MVSHVIIMAISHSGYTEVLAHEFYVSGEVLSFDFSYMRD